MCKHLTKFAENNLGKLNLKFDGYFFVLFICGVDMCYLSVELSWNPQPGPATKA